MKLFPAADGLSRYRVMLTIAAATAIIVAAFALGIYDTQVYRAQAFRQADTDAKILAATVVGALAFNDNDAAQDYVNALAENPSIAAAAIYDLDGARVAAYVRNQSSVVPPRAPAVGGDFQGAYVDIVRAVTQKDKLLGTVYVSRVTEPLARRLTRYASIILLVTLGVLVVSVLVQMNTELSRANERLRSEMAERGKAEDALRQAQKMEAIGRLTGGIAHDFNNMLAVVIGGLELVRRRLAKGETNLDQYIESALGGARRAATLTQRLLAFSRQQPLQPSPVDPNNLVAGMSELLRRTIGEAYAIETSLGANVGRIQVDPHQLENVILNLAVNSRDAMPNGGKLIIETANVALDDAQAAEGNVVPGPYVMIAVVDTGIGMTPEVLAKAFDPFFTTKGVGQGTGLGLSQVYGFIRQSGGHVKLESTMGAGTAVNIYLPRYFGEMTAEPVAKPSTVLQEANDVVTVLVVEDEPAVRGFVVTAIRDLGYRTLEAEGGHAALEILKDHPEVGLLFTDIVMPHMNGRQLAEEAVRLRPRLKVLFTTGYTRETGPTDPDIRLLSKPFTLEQLSAALRSVLEAKPAGAAPRG